VLTIATNQPKLLDCPFCHSDGTLHIEENPDVPEQEASYVVICDACGARGPLCGSPMEAAGWWNRCSIKCPHHPGAFMEPGEVICHPVGEVRLWHCSCCNWKLVRLI